MAVSYDLSTSIGKVRLLIPDRDESNPVFADEEIELFLELEGDVYRSSALALETIASDNAAVLRVTKILGTSVDGVRTAEALMKRAEALRKRADKLDSEADGFFDWAEMAVDDFSSREIKMASILRETV